MGGLAGHSQSSHSGGGYTQRAPVSASPWQAVEKMLRRSEAVGALKALLKLAWAAASGQGKGQGCSPASGAGVAMGETTGKCILGRRNRK